MSNSNTKQLVRALKSTLALLEYSHAQEPFVGHQLAVLLSARLELSHWEAENKGAALVESLLGDLVARRLLKEMDQDELFNMTKNWEKMVADAGLK